MPRSRALILSAALLILLAAAFLLLDLRLMSSQTNVSSHAAAGRNVPDLWQFQPGLTGIYLDGPAALEQPLRAALHKTLLHQQRIGDLTDINAPADQMDIPVLYSTVRQTSAVWTPFYARSETRVVVSYASNGDVSFREQSAPRFFGSSSDPAIQFQAVISLTDTSWGLISPRGYQNHLAAQIAQQVSKQIQEQVQ